MSSKTIFDQIEEESQKQHQFYKVNPGEKRIFKFDTSKIQIVDSEYQGKKSRRARYMVIDPNIQFEEKQWEISMTHAVQLNALLKKGILLVEVQRLGGGRDTKYSFVPA